MDGSSIAVHPQSASARLAALAARLGEARVSVGDVAAALGDTGLGLSLVLLMLPVFIAIPGMPVGIIFGAVVALLGLQLISGRHGLSLPRRLSAHTLDAPQLRRVLLGSVPWLLRAERWLHHGRLAALTSGTSHRLIGLILVTQGLALAVPIPFGNHPPALAVVAIGLGLMERDGMAIALGLMLSLLALVWIGVLFVASAEVLAWAAGLLGW